MAALKSPGSNMNNRRDLFFYAGEWLFVLDEHQTAGRLANVLGDMRCSIGNGHSVSRPSLYDARLPTS